MIKRRLIKTNVDKMKQNIVFNFHLLFYDVFCSSTTIIEIPSSKIAELCNCCNCVKVAIVCGTNINWTEIIVELLSWDNICNNFPSIIRPNEERNVNDKISCEDEISLIVIMYSWPLWKLGGGVGVGVLELTEWFG